VNVTEGRGTTPHCYPSVANLTATHIDFLLVFEFSVESGFTVIESCYSSSAVLPHTPVPIRTARQAQQHGYKLAYSNGRDPCCRRGHTLS
jgi:hypothetical protein